MTQGYDSIRADTSLQEVVDPHVLQTGQRTFVVEQSGRVAGLLTINTGSRLWISNLVSGVTLFTASILAGLLWNFYGSSIVFLVGGGIATVALVALLLAVPWRTVEEATH